MIYFEKTDKKQLKILNPQNNIKIMEWLGIPQRIEYFDRLILTKININS